MGYSIFSPKAAECFKKCQFCFNGLVLWMAYKNSEKSGNSWSSKFSRGFLGDAIFLEDWVDQISKFKFDVKLFKGEIQKRKKNLNVSTSHNLPKRWQTRSDHKLHSLQCRNSTGIVRIWIHIRVKKLQMKAMNWLNYVVPF